MKNKILGIVLATILLITLSAVPTAAAETGRGTKTDPYTISDLAGLEQLAEKVQSGETCKGRYYVLTADIKDPFQKPIGTAEHPFGGHFNGNGHAIGVKAEVYGTDNVGLFGYTDGAVIQNLCVKGIVSAANYVGAVVGHAVGTTIEDCRVINMKVIGTGICVGGIVGYADQSTVIRRCTFEGAAIADNTIGGIAGMLSPDSLINSCANSGIITALSTQAGGIVGAAQNGARVENCVNYGEIDGKDYLGGIAGYMGGGTVDTCYNAGKITVGGTCGTVAGYAKGARIVNAYYKTDIYNNPAQAVNGEDNDCAITPCDDVFFSEKILAYELNAAAQKGWTRWEIDDEKDAVLNFDAIADAAAVTPMWLWIVLIVAVAAAVAGLAGVAYASRRKATSKKS